MTKYRLEAQDAWNRARRRAMWMNLRYQVLGQSTNLRNFSDIAARLNLQNTIYEGTQSIPLDRIIGSVGRYQDFTSTFLPKSDDMANRWSAVARLQLDPHSPGLPPIEAYAVGQWYFVNDGNHRVSVAHELGFDDIEAYVWRYPEPELPIDETTDIDTLLLEWEHHDFLDKSKLNELRPDHIYEVTVPGGYHYALCQIANYQAALSQIDETTVPYEEAVTGWYDMYFEGVVHRIREMDLRDLFPNRTEADFFVWVTRHKDELEREYSQSIRITQAVSHLEERYKGVRGFIRRLLTRKG